MTTFLTVLLVSLYWCSLVNKLYFNLTKHALGKKALRKDDDYEPWKTKLPKKYHVFQGNYHQLSGVQFHKFFPAHPPEKEKEIVENPNIYAALKLAVPPKVKRSAAIATDDEPFADKGEGKLPSHKEGEIKSHGRDEFFDRDEYAKHLIGNVSVAAVLLCF